MTTDYATVSMLRDYIGMGSATMGTAYPEDTFLQMALDSSAQAIEQFCGRTFHVAGTAVSDKYLTSDHSSRLRLPDYTGTVTLAGDYDNDGAYETSVVGFVVQEENSEGVPWSVVKMTTEALPCGHLAVKATAKWGWTAVPQAIANATLIQSARTYKRRDSPFGSFGSSDMVGTVKLPWRSSLDPDVQTMLQPYVRGWVAV
jgi:hypothetical protein